MKNFSVIVAATASNWGIGIKGGIPWKLSTDMKVSFIFLQTNYHYSHHKISPI